tara:strand:+ start:66 stop:428 length:363 start_codon:yes stop_codon:yes gene_type:complete
MRWNEVTEEKVSPQHRNAVFAAVKEEMSESKDSIWKKWLLPLVASAVPLGLALVLFRETDKVDSGSPDIMALLGDEESDVLFEFPELLSENQDLLENLDLLEDLELLESLPNDESEWDNV